MEYLELYNDAIKQLKIMREYIEKLEAERDYYQEASDFAGVPNTPKPIIEETLGE